MSEIGSIQSAMQAVDAALDAFEQSKGDLVLGDFRSTNAFRTIEDAEFSMVFNRDWLLAICERYERWHKLAADRWPIRSARCLMQIAYATACLNQIPHLMEK